jgi:DNA repair exonuclease SbcCD ATPase subunit
MKLKEIEKEIAGLQKDMIISYRRTVDDAIRIGGLLSEAKKQLPYGEFMPWCKKQGIDKSTANNYQKVFEYSLKLLNVSNLSEAYKLIENEEEQKKRKEFQEQSKRIDEYKRTGKKPDGWNDKTDYYRLKKEREDEEYRKRKQELFDQKEEQRKQRKRKIEEEKKKENDEYEKHKQETQEVLEGLTKLQLAIEEKDRLFKKMNLTGDNSKEPIYDALLEYLLGLNENVRLEACHNIIKFCKTMANELQRRSIK